MPPTRWVRVRARCPSAEPLGTGGRWDRATGACQSKPPNITANTERGGREKHSSHFPKTSPTPDLVWRDLELTESPLWRQRATLFFLWVIWSDRVKEWAHTALITKYSDKWKSCKSETYFISAIKGAYVLPLLNQMHFLFTQQEGSVHCQPFAS